MNIKTSELIGIQLNWAVAKCKGFRSELNLQYTEGRRFDGWWQCGPHHWQPLCDYSADWSQGGPIIEREKFDFEWVTSDRCRASYNWLDETFYEGFGPTPLIATMRCYVASKLGDTIDIPDELC